MQIQERSFSGKIFRPKPHCYLSSNKKLLTVLTPWGQEATDPKNVFENLENLYSRLSEDTESTHPFPKLLSLSATENNMRTSVMQVNQDIFNSINQEEYAMGFELSFIAIVENIVAFIQIGQPFILIDRPNQPLNSLGQVMDVSLNNFVQDKTLPPLPYQLMGIHSDISFSSFFFRFHPEDKLILLSHSHIPTPWFNLKRQDRTLDQLSQLAVQENAHKPFWLSIVDLTDS